MTHDVLCPHSLNETMPELGTFNPLPCKCDSLMKSRVMERETFKNGLVFGWCIGNTCMIPVVLILAVWR